MPTENRSSNTEQMVSVPASKLKKIHRDLDACQKVIWLRGGFDPAYCKDAQDSLKDIDALLIQPPDQGEPVAWLNIVSGNTFDNAEAIETAGRKAFPLYSHPATSDGYSAGDMADQGAKAFWEGQQTRATEDDRRLIEAMAEAIYNQWKSQAGFVRWVPGGNSEKQEDARCIARRALTESRQE
ncbi:hypothetical protein [Pseudomonas alkylphenolica]|uniref:hypothetical protein n=1 Tax=Pseudomonas alkylphenolica TaxID=237609 RepID=UPI0018D73F25|nr:hypothetical protein [Pseudomonas alkylphenolica]MBH3426171.1 hypothetical protein [Pseudomonas alkylphenolica]